MSVFIDSEKCKGCGTCASVCPVQAISIIQDKAFIDQTKCNECCQCLDECPNNAIYQTTDKEISAAKKEDSAPYSVHHIFPQSHQILGSYSDRRKQRIFNRSGGLLDKIKEAANNFFQADSSFGGRRRIRKRGHHDQRRGYRGGRFKH